MKVAIVGAGAGGLAAAHDLARAGRSVTVFESEAQIGGLAAGFRDPGWDWSVEQYYHHWFASDHDILGLIDELGWRDKVVFPWPITAAYFGDRFYPLDGPLSLHWPRAHWLDRLPGAGFLSRTLNVLRFPALTKPEALRAGLVGLSLVLTRDWRPLEQVTAHEWLSRRMGKRCYEVLWEPLLISKFGAYYREVNMAWFWARVKARTPRLGTFEGGFQAFLESLADHVRSEGVAIRLRSPVRRIERRAEGGLTLGLEGGSEWFDQVLVTTSPGLLARLAPGLPDEYLGRLRALKSMGAVVLVMALRHRLSEAGYYWHNLPKPAGFPFLALVEHTNFLSPDHFGGDHIVYCGDYLDPSHEYFSLTQEQLLARFLPSLPRFNPRFSPEWVRSSWLFRTPYAQPVPPVHHSRAIPDLKTPIPGLWLASMSQVYPWDRGTNFAVQIGRAAARRMLSEETPG
ncbi:MAG: oxidoreductase [Chloroflexi bacterium RBG_13_68_17]|nr:MAG: oxidoreductase [Chloroflexi bacterium RBG_13_68_17]